LKENLTFKIDIQAWLQYFQSLRSVPNCGVDIFPSTKNIFQNISDEDLNRALLACRNNTPG
jgi:hypothetical protein